MAGELVVRRLEDHVGVLSYNRPDKHNALSDALHAQYVEALSWALEEPDARVIVLRGEGASFSSGRDVTELGTRPEGVGDFRFVRASQESAYRLLTSAKPVIALVKGYAFGGAFEQCLAADIRIGSPDAVMCLPEILYGILPDMGGTQLLTSLVGPGRAKELILTGRRLLAEEALSWGVLNRIVPTSDLDREGMELARTLARLSPVALAMGKQLVDQCWADQVHRGIRSELLSQTALFGGRDYAEARLARREGRAPDYGAL